jgi:predicted metalloprotease
MAPTTRRQSINRHLFTKYVDNILWVNFLEQKTIKRYGAFAWGAALAHEWGHHNDSVGKAGLVGIANELHADCQAGVFVGASMAKHGLPAGGLMDAYRLFCELGALGNPKTHGTRFARTSVFKKGYLGARSRSTELLGENDCGSERALEAMKDICAVSR